jgi:hypothetical protein
MRDDWPCKSRMRALILGVVLGSLFAAIFDFVLFLFLPVFSIY